jgi:C1A family cysteine protease
LLVNRSTHDNKLLIKNKQKLPLIIDLRNKFSKVYDQGSLGSCLACTFCAIIGYINPKINGSRLFLYYNERMFQNDISVDNGSSLPNGVLALKKYGICSESKWPYIIDNFSIRPSNICYKEALNYKFNKVFNINNTRKNMKKYLNSGYPFIVGIQIYSSFENDNVSQTGIVTMPDTTNETCLGGHAVVCCGYNEKSKMWIMRNSWGTNWGDKGYFYLPYSYLENDNLTTDFWFIKNK